MSDHLGYYTANPKVGVYQEAVTLNAQGEKGSGQYFIPKKLERNKFPFGVELSVNQTAVAAALEADLLRFCKEVLLLDSVTTVGRKKWVTQKKRREGCRAKICILNDRFNFTSSQYAPTSW
jgi:hypothetical protein